MTLFGPDISSYQAGLDLSKLTAASFVIAKVSEGTYYTDGGFHGWQAQALELKLPLIWYHFLTTEDAAAQVHHTSGAIGGALGPAGPGMLDVEPQPQTGSRPTLADVLAYADIARQAGLPLRLVYLPRWYWVQLGQPDLTPLVARGLYLVSSSYPGGTGTPAQLYPGDTAAGWGAYGGMRPALYQYTDRASDGGQLLDYNAFRGDPAEFTAILTGQPAPATGSSGGFPMALSDADQARILNDVANLYSLGFFGGPSCGTTPPGAQNNSLVSKLDFLVAAAQHPAPAPSIDVTALAAAIDAHLNATAAPTADTIAAAVTAHLAADLAKG